MRQRPIDVGDERARLATLRGLDIIDRDLPPTLSDLLNAASALLRVDAATIALVDADTVHLKGRRFPGVPPRLPRSVAFATAVLEAGEPLIVNDVSRDARFAESLVAFGRSFAGFPARAANGHCIGAFVVASRKPRSFTSQEARALGDLTHVVEALITHWVTIDVLMDATAAEDPRAPEARPEAERLRLALGAQAYPRPDISVDPGRTSYNPTLLRLVLRKHAVEILDHLLHHSPARFKDIISAVPGLNQRTLTTRLEELREHGLISRRAYEEIPPRVEYSIPPDVRALVHQLLQLTATPHPMR